MPLKNFNLTLFLSLQQNRLSFFYHEYGKNRFNTPGILLPNLPGPLGAN
jgi:hypothetical protein